MAAGRHASAAPGLWERCRVLLVPALYPGGTRVFDLGADRNHAALGSTRPLRPSEYGLVLDTSAAGGTVMTLGDRAWYDGPRDLTLVSVVSPTVDNSAGSYLFRKTGGGNDAYYCQWLANEDLQFRVYDTVNTTTSPTIGDGIPTNSSGAWFCVGCTIRGATNAVRVWCNGQFAGGTVLGTIGSTNHDIVIGDTDGELDHALFGLWDRVLTDPELRRLQADPYCMLRSRPVTVFRSPPPAGAWKMGPLASPVFGGQLVRA